MLKHISTLLVLGLVSAAAGIAAKTPYEYFRSGNAADAVKTTTAGTVLMGGGADVDAAFHWMCGKSGGGDFLVIRATGTDAYNAYIRGLCPELNSVATLIIPSIAAANHAFVASTLRSAEAIWIAGGDQANYINYWTGTAVQRELNAAIARGVPVGGTSAGMNVLTQFVYSALLSKGVTSSQALADPYSRYITLARDFASVAELAGSIGDPHFAERDRMGRDLAFLCRIAANGWSAAPRGIAVGEATALLIESGGQASVEGAGRAYFLQAPGPAEVCLSKTPLTYRNVSVYRIGAGGTFDLAAWLGRGGAAYQVSAVAGVLSSTQAGGEIY